MRYSARESSGAFYVENGSYGIWEEGADGSDCSQCVAFTMHPDIAKVIAEALSKES